LSDDTDHDLTAWDIDRLETFVATVQAGDRRLEAARWVAQLRAYLDDQPRHLRLRWATLSLKANRRLGGDSPWDRARMLSQDFMLRTWIIEHLGPAPDPDWNLQALAADTLAALTLDPAQARALSASWRDLPIEQISELRRHKNMIAHADRIAGGLAPGPTKDQLNAWIEIRSLLP
jgi:hypothetical protein